MIGTTDINKIITAIQEEMDESIHEGEVHVGFFEEEGSRSSDTRKKTLLARQKLSWEKKTFIRMIRDVEFNKGIEKEYKFSKLPASLNPSSKKRTLQNSTKNMIKNAEESKTERKTNPQIAFWNHYGVVNLRGENGKIRNTPPRPFLDKAINKRTNELSAFIEDILKKNYNTDDLLKLIGERAKHYIQKEIADLREPALSEATISKKLSQDPLIDTGEMIRNVSYRKAK